MYEKEKLARLCELRGFANLVGAIFPEDGIEDHRQFQRRLAEDHLQQLTWILNYLGGRAHELFVWLLRRYQLENLKVLFRGFHARRPPREVKRYIIATPEEFALPVEQMISAAGTDEFAGLVPDASLRAAVIEGLQSYAKKSEPFFFEAALDAAFYSKLLSLADEGSAEGLASCLPLLALDTDIHLVVLVLRARFNYGIDFEEIEAILRVRRAAPVESLRAVHSAESVTAAGQALPKALAKAVGRSVQSVEDVERELGTYLHTRANAAFYGSGITMAVPVAFYFLKRIELGNLIRLAEAYRYGMSAPEMRRALVPPAE